MLEIINRAGADPVARRIQAARPALAALLAEAEAARRARHDRVEREQAFSSFEDAFPTFYQFSNRPR